MPNDVKAYVSAAVALVAIILAYWSGSPVRPEFAKIVLATAAFMIVACGFFRRLAKKRKRRKISVIGKGRLTRAVRPGDPPTLA